MYIIFTNFLDVYDRHLSKMLFPMRLTIIIMLGTIFQSTANGNAQSISINKSNATIVEILLDIRKQTDYDFLYSKPQLANAKKVNISLKNVSITEVLDKCFDKQPFTYTIQNKTITVKKKEPSRLDKVGNIFSLIDIEGVIVDESGLPLAGATVKIKGSTIAVTTDSQGRFSLQNVAEDAVLVISYIGYQAKEIPASDNVGSIKLELTSGDLKEIEINAGYYTVKDRERTGSISRVTAQQIEKQPVNNVLASLSGRLPGVVITQLTGIPGGGFTVQVRGRNSISSGNDPLYIIDGVTYPSTKTSSAVSNSISAGVNPLSMVNPDDISSIEVLKDADATAIYGSRGANGVILITTKKGKTGDIKFNIGIRQGFTEVGRALSLLNTEDYVLMRREAFSNDGLTPSATDYDINGTWDTGKYTNWQRELIGGKANITNASINVTGGNNQTNYLISGNFYNEGTVFPGSFGFQRGTLSSNLNFVSLNGRFSADFSANYGHSQSMLMSTDLTTFILLAPNSPSPYNEYGKLNWDNNTVYLNPLAYLKQTNNDNTDNLISNILIKYNLFKDLVFKSSIGYSTIRREELNKRPLESYSPAFAYTANDRVSYFTDNYNNTVLFEPQLNYQHQLGPGYFDSLFGLSYQSNKNQLRTIRGSGFNSDELMNSITSAGLLTSQEMRYAQYKYAALFARLNYSLSNKYYFNLTARRDGSSRFGQGKQYANFGAIGVAWVFSEEKIIQRYLPFLSFGKLRFSYGVTGNDQISDYGYLQLWGNSGTYQGTPTITPTRIANSNFEWESNKKREAALQLRFFENRIDFEISYYNNRSSNQLVGIPLPPSAAFNDIQANLPALVQNTGWEFNTSFALLKNQFWQWHTTFNLTIPKNKLLSYPGLETSSNSLNYAIGEPLSIKKVYNISGVDTQTGLYTIEDYDGNRIINDQDRFINKFIGVHFYGGLQNSIRFKQLSLDFHISFTKQAGKSYMAGISYTPGLSYANSPLSNQPSIVLDRWQNKGDNSTIQKFSTSTDAYLQYIYSSSNSNLSIEDASFIRLKNVSLAYQLPKKWFEAIKIANGEISLQGQNLFTITNYKGLDPENQSLANLPPLRTLLIELKITF